VYQPVPGFEDHLVKELEGCCASRVKPPTIAGEAIVYPANRVRTEGSRRPDNRDFCGTSDAKIHECNRLPGARIESLGPLFFAPLPEIPDDSGGNSGGFLPFWHQNAWLNPVKIEFDSVSEAANTLRQIQRNWAPAFFTQFRRGALIQEKLPAINRKGRPFPWLLPESPVGAWTLLDARTMIAASRCSSPFPGGIIKFEEDRLGPPSRAYLKLWEALVRCRSWPGPGDRCLDAGASPGGWTWALARLGAEVTAVDRSPLDGKIAALRDAEGRPLVRFIKHDAFTLKPEEIGPVDWLFCDVICYPPRLYGWIEKWLASGLCGNFVCTIKMQGVPDFDTPRLFAAVPGSRVLHLYHNKHELTWWTLRRGGNGN
jgi:23S rRNA (cytidine2498-2'-O)-methyltransferase